MNENVRFGNIFEIDLETAAVESTELTEGAVLSCLGGFGFNIEYLYYHLPKNVQPLDSGNVLLITPGLLTGSAAPSSSRVHINALSPLSGLIGSSSVGGSLGSKLRSLHIAALIIKGASQDPVFLDISDSGIRIADARELWGLDTRETELRIKEIISDDHAELLTIGPAGENLVRYACIMAGIDHSAGHTGMGAVMGSKNIKALCVHGEITNPPTPEEAKGPVHDYIRSIRGSVSRFQDYSTLGSSGDILELNNMGLLGTKNYRSMQLQDAHRIDGRNLRSYVTKHITCPRCAVRCKAEVELKEGKHKGFRGGRPEYETVIDLGALCGLTDPDALIYLSNLCNILGLDTISTGSVLAFAMDLYDRNIISHEDTGGIRLLWGDASAMEEIMRQIAERRGFGAILAEGVHLASQRIGKGAEKYAYHVKGVELYGADPRGMMGTALSYAVSMRGGDFTSVYPVPEFRYSPERAEKEFGTAEAVNYRGTEGKGALVRYCMIVSTLMDSLGICKVPALTIAGNYDLEKELALIRALTGLEIDKERLLFIGERIVTMEKLFNLRFGADAGMDTLPNMFLTDPIAEGPSAGAKVDLKPMVQDFYRRMGWDERGVPLPETLKALNLD